MCKISTPARLARLGQTLGDSDLQLTTFLLRLSLGQGCADLAGAVCLTRLHKDIGDRHSLVRHQGRSDQGCDYLEH